MAITAPRVRAPEPRGSGGWINAPSSPTLASLRGRVVLLHFMTLGCINCLHALEELRALEARFPGELQVLGIHSPKFPHEADQDVLVQSLARHRVEHPVLHDPELETWRQYAVRAWPTIVVIDPGGYVVGSVSGEGHEQALKELVDRLAGEAEASGTLRRAGSARSIPVPGAPGTLAFPGKVASDRRGRLVVADTGHDRVLVVGLDGTLLAEHGPFAEPQGVRFDGEDLIVCETAAGRVWRVAPGGSRTLLSGRISSPWDVAREGERLVVCEAGRHRLVALEAGGERPVAGTGVESLGDGPAADALLAQPSGVAPLVDGGVAFVDSESSALRVLREGHVSTLAGHGLFEWGSADGDRESARLQHPLGVAGADDGSIYVADTFNGLLRVWREGWLATLPVRGLAEPGGLDVLPDGRLAVADTGNHRVVVVHPFTGTVDPVPLGDFDHA